MSVLDLTINVTRWGEYAGIFLTLVAGMGLIWRPIKRVLERYDKSLAEADCQLKKHADTLKRQAEINEEQEESIEAFSVSLVALQQGVQQILRFRLQRECERINRRKCITQKEYEDLYKIHEAYEALGQNGLIGSVYKEAINQPRKD